MLVRSGYALKANSGLIYLGMDLEKAEKIHFKQTEKCNLVEIFQDINNLEIKERKII